MPENLLQYKGFTGQITANMEDEYKFEARIRHQDEHLQNPESRDYGTVVGTSLGELKASFRRRVNEIWNTRTEGHWPKPHCKSEATHEGVSESQSEQLNDCAALLAEQREQIQHLEQRIEDLEGLEGQLENALGAIHLAADDLTSALRSAFEHE